MRINKFLKSIFNFNDLFGMIVLKQYQKEMLNLSFDHHNNQLHRIYITRNQNRPNILAIDDYDCCNNKLTENIFKNMNNPKYKVCPECQFEAQNGHHKTCSQFGGIKSPKDFGRAFEAIKHVAYPCPECQKSGRYGTLELLNEQEVAKIKINLGDDVYPAQIYGCDECKFWCDAEQLNNI